MKKNDLKVGYLVERRNGATRMVMQYKDELILVNPIAGWGGLDWIKDDLKDKCDRYNDIVAVYGYPPSQLNVLDFNKDRRPLLWKREEVKKMTVEELEKELGYKIEIVSDH